MNLKRYISFLFKNLLLAALAISFSLAPRADELQLLWQLSPDDGVPYLGNGNLERGVAYNPITGNVLLVSRADNEIHILSGQDGSDLGVLNKADVITGGLFVVNMIGIADDGAIYVANLTTDATNPVNPYKIYRWESEDAAAPTVAFEGHPGEGDDTAVRWGDSFAVRGSGADTQLAAGAGGSSTLGAVFTTTDGVTFTANKVSNIAANTLSFGSDNTLWAKRSGASLRLVEFNLATGEGTLRPLASGSVPITVIGIAANPTDNVLAGINILAGPDEFRLWDVSDTNSFLGIDHENFPADNANANAAGSSDIVDDIVVSLDTNNGLMVFRIIESISPVEFVSHPTGLVLLEGGIGTLSATVGGTPPISLQWQLNGNNVPGATNSSLVLSNIALTQGGSYTLVASNAAGQLTSDPAVVTVEPRIERATVLWRLAPGERPYITTGNTERGIAYNKVSNRVLVVSRTSGVNIHVLDGDTGADLGTLQTPTDIVTGSAPAGFRLNMIGVADDGAVYAVNLDNASGSTFAIYRWENDDTNTVPTVAWSGVTVDSRRIGDTLDVRGSGPDTQILLATQNSAATDDNTVVLMTTTDGLNFTPNIITIPGLNDDYLRLGIAFGASNTFWGKTAGQPLRQVEYDLLTGLGTEIQAYSNVLASATAVSVHPGSNLVAVVALETPDSLRIYDINSASQSVTFVDQEFFPTDNANGNGTGAVDFGGDRLYALDTNNGIIAAQLTGGTQPGAVQFTNVRRSGSDIIVTITGTPNAAVQLQSTTNFSSWTDGQSAQIGAGGTVDLTITGATEPYRFYRIVQP